MAESAPTIFGDESPEEFKRRRAYAQLLMQMGLQPQEPERSWTQGAARALQSALGGYEIYRTNQEEKAARTAADEAGFKALQQQSTAVSPAVQRVAGAFNPAQFSDAGGMMDNPVARTVLAEAGNQGPAGMQAVAGVIANRAKATGKTPEEIVRERNQFEPWNTAQGRTRMAAFAPNRVQEALAVTNPVLQGQAPSPVGEATHFYAPKAQRALGRAPPRWDNGTGVDFGDHRFFKLPYGGGQTVTGGQQMAQAPAAAPAMPAAQPNRDAMLRALTNRHMSPGIQSLLSAKLSAEFAPKNPTIVPEGGTAIGPDGKVIFTGPEKQTEDQRNFAAELKTPGLAQRRTELRKASATNVNVGGGSDKQIFDEISDSYKAARTAATGITGLREARAAVESGAILGAAANQRLGLQKIIALLGGDASQVTNTETFRSAIAPQVAAMLKATVGTTQISNTDREFAEKAAGGSITLDEGTIKRLLGIMEKAGTGVISEHQKRVDKVYGDPEKFGRERALFGVEMPADTGGWTDLGGGVRIRKK